MKQKKPFWINTIQINQESIFFDYQKKSFYNLTKI